jgi:predicted lysophospholipase L1 biosynthesis ABC-type transport system permease subunit
VWLESDDPERAAAAARAITTRPIEVLTRRGASDAAVLRVGTSLAWAGAIACLVLALIGFAAVAGALHRDRRDEGTALRSLGFGSVDQARSRGVELGLTAASAILLGVGVGALAAWLTVPALAGDFALATAPWLIALAAFASGLIVVGLLAAIRVARDVARGGRA